MEVLNARAALLSNYEVLDLLREIDATHVAKMKTAQRIKKEEEEEAAKKGVKYEKPLDRRDVTTIDIPDNLRTVELEAIQYLSADFQPTGRQTSSGIQKLVKSLASYDFTKGEKLQIVNLAPTQQVELYTIIEELEDRLATDEEREHILELVRASLSKASGDDLPLPPSNENSRNKVAANIVAEPEQEDWNDYYQEEFDDTGQGAGIEGDLEMDED